MEDLPMCRGFIESKDVDKQKVDCRLELSLIELFLFIMVLRLIIP